MKSKKFTIKDIAKLAKVSIATVSRVINNSPYVDEKTRKKVLKLIEEYKYIPNLAAKSLPSKTAKLPYKKCIAIVIADTAKYGFANLFFSKVFYGIMEETVEYRYNLFTRIIKTSGYDIFEEITTIINNSDGIIAMGHGVEDFVCEVIKINNSFPIVLIESYSKVPSIKINSVLVNNFEAGYLATKYLIDCGHKKIAIVKGPDEYISSFNRYKGFLEALKENHIDIPKEYIETGNLEYIGGYEAALRMIKKLKKKDFPTAIFCVNDFTALGVKDALEKNGFLIPKDISLVGFDNIELTQQVIPTLTTMDVPKEELGRLAIKRLNELIYGNDSSKVCLTVFAQLIERESVRILKT
ncbi:MAG: LacI family transcriptional regulator [Endomicrobia bacterium]|nr:LacI family transcriptional regulator [Endomicrobiia bacterium]